MSPPYAVKRSGFTLLFEALLLGLDQQMPFRDFARGTGLSIQRVTAIREGCVEHALTEANLSEERQFAVDEPSRVTEPAIVHLP